MASGLSPVERRLRIGFVGAGDRLTRIYLPILRPLSDEFDLVGFTTRSAARAQSFAGASGLTAFPDAPGLVAAQKPDLLVVALAEIDQTLPPLLDLGTPLLVETPFCWNVRSGRKLGERIRRSGLLVGVAEQTPFLPVERLKAAVIEAGALGQVIAAQNDFAVFAYHGIAALRAYAAEGAGGARVSAVWALHPVGLGDGEGDEWISATISCAGGTTLSHQYSDRYFDSPLRFPQALRLYGTTGTIVGEAAAFATPDGETMHVPIRRLMQDGSLAGLAIDTPLGALRWDNPFAGRGFDDEKIAVATLLRGMRDAAFHGGAPLYGVEDGLADMEIATAMRLSALRGGVPVRAPVTLAEAAWHKLAERAGGLAGRLGRR